MYNLRKGCKLYFATEKPADMTASETPSSKVETSVDAGEYTSGEPLTHWVSESHVMSSTIGGGRDPRTQKRELLGMVQMPKRHYSSVQAVCDDIAGKFQKVFLMRYKLKLTVTRKDSGFITF
jgi:hypothetical protein